MDVKKKGFIRSNCPDCKVKLISSSTNQSSVDIDVCDTSHFVEFSSLDPEWYTFKSQPILSISICGANGIALIDTAAKLSVASASLYNVLLKNNVKFQTVRMNVKLADGSQKKESIQMCSVDVCVQGRAIPTRFVVFPNSTETLLGIEFVLDAGICFDFYNSVWSFHDSNETFLLKYEKSSQHKAIPLSEFSSNMFCNDNVVPPANELKAETNTELLSDIIFSGSEANILKSEITNDEHICEKELIPFLDISSVELILRPEEGSRLEINQKSIVQQLLDKYEGTFAPGGAPTKFVEHHIETGDSRPIAVPPYPLSEPKRQILRKELGTGRRYHRRM